MLLKVKSNIIRLIQDKDPPRDLFVISGSCVVDLIICDNNNKPYELVNYSITVLSIRFPSYLRSDEFVFTQPFMIHESRLSTEVALCFTFPFYGELTTAIHHHPPPLLIVLYNVQSTLLISAE